MLEFFTSKFYSLKKIIGPIAKRDFLKMKIYFFPLRKIQHLRHAVIIDFTTIDKLILNVYVILAWLT